MEQPHHIARNARYGLILFAIYVIFYGGFVAVSAFAPGVMAKDLGGVNLAVVYGFALIVIAFVLALVYMFLCRDGGDRSGDDDDAEGRRL